MPTLDRQTNQYLQDETNTKQLLETNKQSRTCYEHNLQTSDDSGFDNCKSIVKNNIFINSVLSPF